MYWIRLPCRIGSWFRGCLQLPYMVCSRGGGYSILLCVTGSRFDACRPDICVRRSGDSSTSVTSRAASISGIPEKSIAVLPFENLSANQENAFFTNGVQDEILTNLAHI